MSVWAVHLCHDRSGHARTLGAEISVHTVKYHVASILEKLDTTSGVEKASASYPVRDEQRSGSDCRRPWENFSCGHCEKRAWEAHGKPLHVNLPDGAVSALPARSVRERCAPPKLSLVCG
jgi:hypothetical protein